MKLIRLDNGDWIDPETVRSITSAPIIVNEYGFHPARVIVMYCAIGGHEMHSVIEVQEGIENEYADKLAKEVNEART